MPRPALSPIRSAHWLVILAFAATVPGLGCQSQEAAGPPGPHEASTLAAAEGASPPPVASGPRIVVLGDSLTAGLGIDPAQAFPAQLERRLKAEGYLATVVAAGVSGDTTAGGLRRLDWALSGDVRILIVALGGNDGLRGLPVAEVKQNLAEIISRAQARGIAVMLTGMEAPPNFGRTYTVEFREAFHELAREHRVTFVPFLLAGVAGEARLNQRDGIHPNPEGARAVADHLWPTLQSMLDRALTQ